MRDRVATLMATYRDSMPCAYNRAPDCSASTLRLLAHASKLLHHARPARGVRSALAAVARPFARTRVSRRIDGVQRALRATDDVDEVHASIAASSAQL
jgi:hypothetical protein